MTPLLVEPLSEQAYELLRQLEMRRMLRVVQPAEPLAAASPRKWAGALATGNPYSAFEWDEHGQESRNAWERDS